MDGGTTYLPCRCSVAVAKHPTSENVCSPSIQASLVSDGDDDLVFETLLAEIRNGKGGVTKWATLRVQHLVGGLVLRRTYDMLDDRARATLLNQTCEIVRLLGTPSERLLHAEQYVVYSASAAAQGCGR